MQLGLFIRRALITSARRGAVFVDRVAAVTVTAAVVAGCILFWDRLGWDRTTIAGTAWFGVSTFGVVAGSLALLAMSLACNWVAQAIASERDRKSHDSLLATRLTSAEIVAGMMTAGLVRSASWLSAALPVVILVAVAGGVPPRLVLLTGVGIGSSMFAASALAAVVSVYTPSRAGATAVGAGVFLAWIDIPLLFEFIQPRVWPGIPRSFLDAVHCLVDSTPAGMAMGVFEPALVPRPFGPIKAFARMIAFQICGGSLLLLWAIWQLRPVSRALYDGDWPAHARWLFRAIKRRPQPRPPLGNDPILWNELHSQRASSVAGQIAAWVGRAVGIGVVALGTSWFALPAFTELAERGYGASREGFTTPEINPLARVLIGKLLLPAGSAAPGQARLEFNMALRQFSALFVMLYVAIVCGTATMGTLHERERDTWHSVIATPLTAWEILRAKMVAALWRARSAGLMLIALWVVGVAAGSVHPLGFLNAVVALIAIGAFYAAFGVSLSLQISELKQANSTLLLVVLCVIPISALAIFLPGNASVFPGACSPPFLIWSSLFSYEDVQSSVRSGALPQFGATGFKADVSARIVLAACWFATIAHAVGAHILASVTCRRFNALVGRPVRPRKNGSARE
jgi:ABC-type Na+ efflux pump permease subunit